MLDPDQAFAALGGTRFGGGTILHYWKRLLEFWKVECRTYRKQPTTQSSSVCAMEAGSRSALFARPTKKKCWRQSEEPASNRCSGASLCQSSTFRTRSSTSS